MLHILKKNRNILPDTAGNTPACLREDHAGMRVIVGMSGGVDSSVAALLLKEQGYQVSGIFMQNWEDDDEHCTARQDYRDAAGVADAIGIALDTVNFAEEYWQRVFAHFLDEYSAGRTPNPDILCNKEIKFRAFLDHARSLGADAIATGHYVRVGASEAEGVAGGVDLLRGLDTNKDQSYFLHTLDQQQLMPSLFPIGGFEKPWVRARARDAGLVVHRKKDSTGICFIGERKFTAFLAEYLPAQPGNIVDEHDTVIGRHNGLMYYTYGQRQGLGIGGMANADESPWFVIEKDLAENRLVVAQGHDHPRLLRDSLDAHDVHWVHGQPPANAFRCSAKVRYRQDDQPVSIVADAANATLSAHFDKPVRAITPGQSIVLYDGERCLGGGIISDF